MFLRAWFFGKASLRKDRDVHGSRYAGCKVSAYFFDVTKRYLCPILTVVFHDSLWFTLLQHEVYRR